MAKVRALEEGFDGTVKREPGDEFDMDPEQQGGGDCWFEWVNEEDRVTADRALLRRQLERKLRVQIEGKVMAEELERRAREQTELEAQIRGEIEAQIRAEIPAKMPPLAGKAPESKPQRKASEA